jgi:hypothetical protein
MSAAKRVAAAPAAAVSKQAVAALFLQRQWLDKPQGRKFTPANMSAFVSRTCGLQIDSIPVIERAHHLTLWSRFGVYDRARFDALVYEERVLFEYLTHVACFVATSDLPMVRFWMEETPQRWRKRSGPWLRRSTALLQEVEEAVRVNGPRGTSDFERKGRRKPGDWGSGKPAAQAMDYLWKCGRLAVRSRENLEKRYDLAERVLPQIATPSGHTRAQALRERLLRSLTAMGAATLADLGAYWTYPGVARAEQRAATQALVREGIVREIRVEGSTAPWYVRAEDEVALQRAEGHPQPSQGTTLLSPFDSFLWHRERTLALFGFHYRIEIYVPEAKRQHGYYSLPLLHDGHLIGRVDAKTHRAEGLLEVKHAHFEDWFHRGHAAPAATWGKLDRDHAIAGTAQALHSLARFVGAKRVTLAKATPASFRAPLARALREEPTS